MEFAGEFLDKMTKDSEKKDAEKKKKNAYVFYEKSDAAAADVQKYARDHMPEGVTEKGTPGKYWHYWGKLIKEGFEVLPGMFEQDWHKIKDNPNLADYNRVGIPLGEGSTMDTIHKYTNMAKKDDKIAIFGHEDAKNNKYGTIPLDQWGIPNDVDCYLGACHGKRAGAGAAKTLKRPVVAQNDDDLWSGVNAKGKDWESSLFYNYDGNENPRYETYNPPPLTPPVEETPITNTTTGLIEY